MIKISILIEICRYICYSDTIFCTQGQGYSLIDPDVTGFWTGKLKITVKKAAQLTTMALTSQPSFPRLKPFFLGRYLGLRDRYINREAGKAKDMISVIIAVPMKTLNARHLSAWGSLSSSTVVDAAE